MQHKDTHKNEPKTLGDKIFQESGISVSKCYQCGKCTAGCPLNQEMDIMPNQILRMLQSDMPGYEDKILRSYAIWLCLTCETCYSRCPQEVEFASVMDFLRKESIRQDKVNPKARNILKFHETFLESVKNNGRMFEVGLIVGYKQKTLTLLQDMTVAPAMFVKGKLSLLPHKIKGRKAIADIFKKTIEQKGGKS